MELRHCIITFMNLHIDLRVTDAVHRPFTGRIQFKGPTKPCEDFFPTFPSNEQSIQFAEFHLPPHETPKVNYYVPHGFWAVNKTCEV